jgi:hypothetical protein
MGDPITLSVIGAVALTEGIKFLYTQTGEVLKRWSERRKGTEKSTEHSDQTAVVEIKLPEVFEGQLSDPKIHFDVVERLEPQLRAVREGLSSYADETYRTDPTDEELVTTLDALRRMLEAVYRQRITFKGEQRPVSGTTIEGAIDVEKVQGDVAAVRARTIKGGKVTGTAKAKEVLAGGELSGVKVDIVE